jgi:hypothetical protein
MQSQIEELELRYKTELSRVKSKLQNELDEIRLRYESLKKVKGELENHLKKLQGTVKDAQDRLIEEQTTHNATRDLLSASEKRFGKFHSRKEKQTIHYSFNFRSYSFRNRRITCFSRSRMLFQSILNLMFFLLLLLSRVKKLVKQLNLNYMILKYD